MKADVELEPMLNCTARKKKKERKSCEKGLLIIVVTIKITMLTD